MSSSEAKELPTSMKNLWTLLSGSLHLKSSQFIANELEQCQKQLIDGVLFYKKHDSKKNSLEELRKSNNLNLKPEVLYNLSTFLDLDALQCCDLFQLYLLNEYRGTPEMAKSMFTNEKQLKELFHNLWHYYHSERIFGLFCFKQILGNWKTKDHIYNKIFQDFLKYIKNNNQLLTKLIDQLKYLISFNFESRSKYGVYFTDKFLAELKVNIVKEENEILQLLLLYYKNFEPTIENVVELLKIFTENGFETNVTHLPQLNSFCGFLKAILIVEILDPSYLYKCHVDGIDHYIFKSQNSKLIAEIHSMVMNLNNSTVEHSVVFMCWMIIKVLLGEDDEFVHRLGMNALQLKIFRFIDQSIHSGSMLALKDSFIHSLIFEIIGNFLAVTFTMFDFEKFVRNEPTLGELIIQLFTNDSIARMVFENGLASGFGLAIHYALEQFPFKTHFLLSLLHSLAQTSSCRVIFEKMSIISTLFSFSELFDSSFTDFAPIDSENFVLVNDKCYSNSTEVMIKRDTRGSLIHIEGNRLIKWKDIAIDGWKLIYFRLKSLIELIRQGEIYSTLVNDEVVLNEISKVAFICSELIGHSAHTNIGHFGPIVRLLLEVYKLVINFNPATIRLYMAGLIQLCVSIMKFHYLSSDQVWFLLTEKKFLPYMIGFSNRFEEILAGTDTNFSTLGYILTSDEFIKGNYELTFAFLDLILYCVNREVFVEEDMFVASFIFIIKDIFPSHKLWNYRNEFDATRIEKKCIEIFHSILKRLRKKNHAELNQVEKICTILLMEGNSAEHLLNIIKNGEEVVKLKILNSGNSSLLIKDNQIISVRTSLLILSYLLDVYSKNDFLASHKRKSVIEDIIFSSTNNNKLNMLLIFIYFVYQKYDINLAINSIQLLSQLAHQFPMSMLACFGSNTEYIRDHFLVRLETLSEDINFKIALLDFLSICVEHQPGLVEMFLNVDNNQGGVLNPILEILEEKLEGVHYCPFNLHQASLQFVAKFWLRPNIIAINLLKKNSKFWNLATFPLFCEEEYNNSLCTFILKILSREIFYTKMLDKNNFTVELEQVFTKMKKGQIFKRLSNHIQQRISGSVDFDEEVLSFIDSWKDFLASWTKFMSQPVECICFDIITDIMKNIIHLLKHNERNKNGKLINKLANLLLIITTNWTAATVIPNEEEFNQNVIEIFQCVSVHKNAVSFNSMISLNTFLLKVLLHKPAKVISGNLFEYVCGLLNSSLQLFSKQMTLIRDPKLPLTLEKRLITSNMFILVSMLRLCPDQHGKFLNILRENEISQQIFNLMLHLINGNLHLDLAQNLPSFFVTLSYYPIGAELLYNLNIIHNFYVCFNFSTELFTSKTDDPQSSYIKTIFSLLIRTTINMLIHLNHHFIDSCVSFVAVYVDVFKVICKSFRQTPKIKNARLVLLMFELCSTLSKYTKIWNTHHPISLNVATEEILLTSNSVIAFILRPNIVAQSLDDLPNSNQRKLPGTADFSKIPMFEEFQDLLIQILTHSLMFVIDVSPKLFELFEFPESITEKYNLLISTNFSIPNIDSVEILTFGSIINLINFIIKSIYKLEKDLLTQTNDSKGKALNAKIEIYISLLELSITILLIQTMVAKSWPKINQIDKQIFFREINNEVNTFKSNILSKPHRRQNSLSTLSTTLPTKSITNINLMERQYLKLILNLIESVIQ